MGGGIGGPPVYTWTCGQCGRLLGSGTNPPPMAYCPVCRVNNIIPGAGGPGVAAAGMTQPPSSEPSEPSELSPSRSRVAWVLVITLGVLVLLGVGIGAVVVTLVKNQPERPRRRRRRYDD
jgi:hypothetical protein